MLIRPQCRRRPTAFTLPLRPCPRRPRHRPITTTRTRHDPARPDSTPALENTTENNPLLRKIQTQEHVAAESRRKFNAPSTSDPTNHREELPEMGALSEKSLLVSKLTKLDETEVAKSSVLGQVIPDTRVLALDPRPMQRRRWERKMVIREIRKRGRLSKAQILKRTERALTAKGPFLKTSMKKLNPLANQIAGKPIEDAIVQMRYSKKKAAVEIKKQLEAARDQAIVERGMGLGQADESKRGARMFVTLKDGSNHKIHDRTGIYVDQAWTGKGPYGQDRNPRARGRVDKLSLPQTSISVLLKEEVTRIREHDERKERATKKKIWTPLPDRPITGQRQYYCW